MIQFETNRNVVKITGRMRYLKKQSPDQEGLASASLPRDLFRGKRGTVAVMVALCAPALLMAVGLGIEASGWTAITQRLQRTADMAAIAGAYASYAGASAQLSADQAAYTAEINAATGVSSTTTPSTRQWTANTLPTASVLTDNLIKIQKLPGIKNTSDVAFSATIQDTVPLLFSHLFLTGPNITLSATATAEITPSAPDCVLALDTGNATGATTAGIDLSNGGSIILSQCGIQVNAAGADALYVSASLTAQSVSVVGGITVSNATMTVSGATTTGAPAQANPYAGVTLPTADTSHCLGGSPFINGQNIPAGTYCGGLSVSYGTVTMGPGNIIINNGSFNPGGGSIINATAAGGTTIILTGSSVGDINVTNNVKLNIVAPSNGPLHGIAIIDATGTATNMIAGGATMNITGAMIFPLSLVQFSNGSSSTAACTQLIAYQVQFTGAARFANNCAGTGTVPIGPAGGVSLVQ
jgi:Flp pilus assembly protein TadG